MSRQEAQRRPKRAAAPSAGSLEERPLKAKMRNDRGEAIVGPKDATASGPDPPSPTATAPHLPAPAWGRVLDFMPYGEVRSALLVGKCIAVEAVQYVQAVNMMRGCELDVPAARRFANVEEVNILCFVSGFDFPRSHNFFFTDGYKDTFSRLVPLLAAFSKLKRIDFAGYFNPRRQPEWTKTICHVLLGAFKARAIPLDCHIKGGVVDTLVGERGVCARPDGAGDDTNSKGMCATCRDVCLYFPLQTILFSWKKIVGFCQCAEEIDVFEALSKRKGAREVFRKASDNVLPEILVQVLIKEFPIERHPKSKEKAALSRKLADFGMRCEGKATQYLTMSAITHLDRLIALGFDPRSVSKANLYREMGIGGDLRMFDVYAKSTFDALVSRGFALDEADLIVLDERMEPALKDLPALMRE